MCLAGCGGNFNRLETVMWLGDESIMLMWLVDGDGGG